MSHPAQRQYVDAVKRRFPQFFVRVRALDVGSLDVNGNNRAHFFGGEYIGIDVTPGKNVDVVSLAHEYDAPPFQTIISTECLEHDKHYGDTLRNCARLLRPGGLLLFTCATTGRPEHGTSKANPKASQAYKVFSDHYKNLTESDIRLEIDVDKLFVNYSFEINRARGDLYFWGIKR